MDGATLYRGVFDGDDAIKTAEGNMEVLPTLVKPGSWENIK